MSTLEVSNLNDGTKTVATTFVTNGSAKGYVHFNGGAVSGSVSIYESFNKSSITDNGTADYTVTATNAMNTTQYIVTASANANVSGFGGLRSSSATASLTSTTEQYYGSTNGNFVELNFLMSATHGDLA